MTPGYISTEEVIERYQLHNKTNYKQAISAIEGDQMGNHLVQGPFFGTALYRFVPIRFVKPGKKLSVDAADLTQIICQDQTYYSLHHLGS